MSRRHRPLFSLNSYIDPRVVRFSLVALVVCLSYGCVQAFMTSFAAERSLSGPASLFFLLYAPLLALHVAAPLLEFFFGFVAQTVDLILSFQQHFLLLGFRRALGFAHNSLGFGLG